MSRDCERGKHEAVRAPEENKNRAALTLPKRLEEFEVYAARIRRDAAEAEAVRLRGLNEELLRTVWSLNAQLDVLRKSKIVQLYDLRDVSEEQRDYEIGRLDGWLCAAVAAAYGKEDLT